MSEPKGAAGGLRSIAVTARHVFRSGLSRAVPALRRVNQPDGFDCPGCAWPESEERGPIEFCENGAKAVAHEATTRRVGRDFFSSWTLLKLREQPGRWLEAQGRLAEPMIRRPGSDRFEPITWDAAFARAGEVLRALPSPDRAVFYTSGRTSNEAAFLYQLFAREFGTNNLPDCSNLCHESSGTGLTASIGIGKGTVSLEDFEHADLILVIGQNPGSNHPRMLSTLQAAVRRGCRIVSINPLQEKGLERFRHPQELRGFVTRGTSLAERFVRVRVGGDVALLKGIMRALLEIEEQCGGGILDRAFLREHTLGFDSLRDTLLACDPDELARLSGVDADEIQELAELYASSERVIACWAMGLTQHRHGVANVQEVMNLLLLRGQIGREGAGPCPIRGHSNVQGDRTMGIWEKPRPAFLDALRREFDFEPPRKEGFSSVDAIEALSEGRVDAFVAMGGNFAAATPDTPRVEEALGRCALGVHVATTLNRTHLLTGEEILLLPCLARSEADVQREGPQRVSVEDSMSRVHASVGRLAPASPALKSEPAIVAGLARATLRDRSRVPWEELAADYRRIRERIERVVPGFERFEERLDEGGFTLPRPPRERRFETPSGRAQFVQVELPEIDQREGELLLTTVRSHDQYNTTVYSLDDRYRGIEGDRRVILAHAEDLRARGIEPGSLVDVRSRFGETERSVKGWKALDYDVPRGCAVAYFPEANPLVPSDAFDARSRTPAYKSIAIRLLPR